MKYNIIFLFLATFFLSSCNNKNANENAGTAKSLLDENTIQLTDAQLSKVGLKTDTLRLDAITQSIQVSGKIDVPPQNLVSVSFPIAAYLKSTSLLPGMRVTKSTVIAVLEDQQFIQLQQDYLTAKARNNYLENEYLRQKQLNASQASSDRSFQQAEAEYLSNKINLSSLKQKLSLIGISVDKLSDQNISKTVKVYSPIEGFVSKVNVNVGKYVIPSEVMFELVNPSDIHLNLSVFEKDLSKLTIGQQVWAYTNSGNKKYKCEIILIGKDIGLDRTVDVHCHFDEYDKTLVPGLYMNALIYINNKNVYVVDEEAIVYFEDKTYVFCKIDSNAFKMIQVDVIEKQNGLIGLSVSSIEIKKYPIVTKGSYSLLMALKNKSEE